MSKSVLTSKMKDFIRVNYLKMSQRKLAEQLGVSKYPVEYFMKKEGLKAPTKLRNKWRAESRLGKTSYTKEMDDFIKENYLKMPIKTLADKIGGSYTGIMGRLRYFGLEIPPEIVERNIQIGRIKKGNVPANKGKKMSDELREKVKHTWFKKGQEPHNTKYDGAITIRHDSTNRPYKYIRISKGNWVLLHRYVWEKANGPIPPGMNILFKDGDTMNCELENLEMVSDSENMKRNTIHNYPDEIKKTILLTRKLTRKLENHEQHHRTEQKAIRNYRGA